MASNKARLEKLMESALPKDRVVALVDVSETGTYIIHGATLEPVTIEARGLTLQEIKSLSDKYNLKLSLYKAEMRKLLPFTKANDRQGAIDAGFSASFYDDYVAMQEFLENDV